METATAIPLVTHYAEHEDLVGKPEVFCKSRGHAPTAACEGKEANLCPRRRRSGRRARDYSSEIRGWLPRARTCLRRPTYWPPFKRRGAVSRAVERRACPSCISGCSEGCPGIPRWP